jgi:hypothetical protein
VARQTPWNDAAVRRLKSIHQEIWEQLKQKPAVHTRPVAYVPRDPFRNETERRYAAQLALEMKAGVITYYAYQYFRLPLARGAHYTPDFASWLPDGRIRLDEVKGFLREAARIRHLMAVERYPQFIWRMLEWKDGRWAEKKV